MRKGEKRKFVLGKNITVEFATVGTIEILLSNFKGAQNCLRLENALYAPDFSVTLVSCIALTKHEHNIFFSKDECVVMGKGEDFLCGRKVEGLIILRLPQRLDFKH